MSLQKCDMLQIQILPQLLPFISLIFNALFNFSRVLGFNLLHTQQQMHKQTICKFAIVGEFCLKNIACKLKC